MDYFYIIVLTVAIVLLIILLTLIGIGMKRHSGAGAGAWPPTEATCPDYWKIDPSDPKYCLIPQRDTANPNVRPRNTGTIYSTDDFSKVDPQFSKTPGYDGANNRINFNDTYYSACNKQAWAKKWGVYWDGYTNYNGCNGK